MPIVFVISADWTLRAGVRAELRHVGVEALGMESLDDASAAIARGTAPSAVVLDAAGTSLTPIQTAALDTLTQRVPVVLVASRTTTDLLPAGSAALLYRPVAIGEIVTRVVEVLQGRAA